MNQTQGIEFISDPVYGANILCFGTLEQRAELILHSRVRCDERGYHRVTSEPTNKEETMICYDCELWFNRGFAEQTGFQYKIEP